MNEKSSHQRGFLFELDGLRAIAVLAVLLHFHVDDERFYYKD